VYGLSVRAKPIPFKQTPIPGLLRPLSPFENSGKLERLREDFFLELPLASSRKTQCAGELTADPSAAKPLEDVREHTFLIQYACW